MAKIRKICVGLAGISFDVAFWGFFESQYKERTAKLRQVTRKLGTSLTAVPKTFSDYKGAIAAAKQLNEKADIVILDVATYPEGKAANAFFNTLEVPLMLWSRNETVHRSNIGHNSFCGANFLGGCLALRNRRFRKLYGPCTSKEFKARLLTACRLVGAAKAAAGSKIALFGEGIVPKFHDIDISDTDRRVLKKRWQISFVGIGIDELLSRVKSYTESEVDRDRKKFTSRFTQIKVGAEAVGRQVRLIRAVREICKKENFAATAIRCWPELQKLYQFWPCPTVSALNDFGIPTACEGDPGGALDMLLARYLGNGPSTLVDIVDWDERGQRFSIWHCGPTACSWADKKGTRLIRHDVDGRCSDGTPKKGLAAVVDMEFAPGKVSVYRTLGALDNEFVIEGQIVPAPRKKIVGSFGAVAESTMYKNKMPVESIRRQIFDRVLPHHYTAAYGHLFS